MSNVKIPDPVAWRWIEKQPTTMTNHKFAEFAPANSDYACNHIEALITTTQAEAYADARVREALEARNNQER